MTKEEILNGMSEAEFYSLYPTKQAWEMACGGTPFGAGIMLQQGGPSPYSALLKDTVMQGESKIIHPEKWNPDGTPKGGPSPVPAMDPDAWDKMYGKPSVSGINDAPAYKTTFPQFNSRGAYDKFKGSNPNFAMYSDADMEGLGVNVPQVFKANPRQKALAYTPAGQSPTGAGLFKNPQGQQFTFSNGAYNPYDPNVVSTPVVAKKSGGDTTMQGANQGFIKQRTNAYTKFLQANVMKNLHEEESQKVNNAFMQMENGMHQMPDGSMMPDGMMQYGAQFNSQNAALQNMYAQNMNQYKDQSRRDFSNFGAMTEDFLSQITAQYGTQVGNVYMPNWEYSNYVPQNDIRTGYALSKSDYAKLAKLEGKGKVTGAKFNYGALGRVAPRMFGPKSIEVGYMNTNKGMFEDLKEPLKFNTEPETQQEKRKWFQKKAKATPAQQNPNPYAGVNDEFAHGELFPQGVYAPGKSPQDFMSSNLYKQPKPTIMGPVDNRSNAWEEMMNKKSNAMAPYSEQFNKKAYGGLFKAQSGYQNPIAFSPRIADNEEDIQVPVDTPTVTEDPNYNPFTDQAAIQKRRAEQNEMFGPPMNDQPDLFASDTVKFKKKTTGVGRFLGKNAPLIADTLSSMLEAKDYRKNDQKMKDLMLADNSFLTTPMNAKNRGDYDPNSGMFRPDDKVPVQFPGTWNAQWGGFNTMQMGGIFDEGEELDLSPEEIAELKAQGYQLEELD